MAIVAFLRGANVGGHRRFRPSIVARDLDEYDVVSIGATGVFVVRRPGKPQEFRNALLQRLPFDTQIAICEGHDLAALERVAAFDEVIAPDMIPFVSIFIDTPSPALPAIPFGVPNEEQWFVRILGRQKQFVFGVYRRHMKTIGYLGQLDKALGAPVTTRNWNTIAAVVQILRTR